MLEAGKFPNRVRQAYSGNQADEILQIFGRINSAVIGYLKAKVNSSLVLALPVGLALGIFGVKFAILWTVLTFACNFIPYVGSIVAYCLPVSFAFLQLESTSTVIVLSVLVLSWHVASAAVIEPMMVGKAVGLSPLVILAALSMWGLLWGLPGMFLAVPLTVVGKIVLENIPMMRAVAQLAGEESQKPS
jgi:AI-2 transport protein TqsA